MRLQCWLLLAAAFIFEFYDIQLRSLGFGKIWHYVFVVVGAVGPPVCLDLLINEIFEPAGIVGVLAGHLCPLLSAMIPYLSLAVWLVHKHSRESDSRQKAAAKRGGDAKETEPKPEAAVAAEQAMREQFAPPFKFVLSPRWILLTACWFRLGRNLELSSPR